jgi:hypothetical protein
MIDVQCLKEHLKGMYLYVVNDSLKNKIQLVKAKKQISIFACMQLYLFVFEKIVN